MKRLTFSICTLLFLNALAYSEPAATEPSFKPKTGFDWSILKSIPIQSRGRIKPLDTYSRESVQFVTGRTTWEGFDPMELVFSWMTAYEKGWEKTAFVRIDFAPLKKAVGLDATKNFFSPEAIKAAEPLKKLAQEASQRAARREKATEMDRKVSQVQNQLGLAEYIARGEEMTILPNPKGIHETWFALSMLSPDGSAGVPYLPVVQVKLIDDIKALTTYYQAGDTTKWNETAKEFARVLREEVAKDAYPAASELAREQHYNSLRPFRWSWVSYTLAFLLLLGFSVTKSLGMKKIGGVFIAVGFLLNTYGFVLRCLIAGRPPVTNMYESVIWVTWGCVAFSLLIWVVYKNHVIPMAASVFAVVGLVLADNLPSVLDPGIHPLEPVLRSNFWLTIHVLTITLSYAAFALSLCLGNVIMGLYLFKAEATERIQSMQLYMYRAVQIGVILIAAGTILGGVWADYSWGRFWGWDPKEVWALIALLLYLAVLHGRFTGWLKGFGFAAACVMCFLGVLMAWYGVNFVLGVGLHSYGFGVGGTSYILAYIFAQLGFIGVAYAKSRKGAKNASIFPGGMKR